MNFFATSSPKDGGPIGPAGHNFTAVRVDEKRSVKTGAAVNAIEIYLF
jgi:hypothetical protein